MDQTEDLRRSFQQTMAQAQALAARVNRGAGGREIALVITKLQEAQFWLGDAEGHMGYAQHGENMPEVRGEG